MSRRWKIVGIVAGVLLLSIGVLVAGFISAVMQFDRPALAACEFTPDASCDGVFVSEDGSGLAYRLLLPAPNPGSPKALLVMLHGAGLNPGAQDWLSNGRLQALATEENVVVALPGAGGEHDAWFDGENPDYAEAEGIEDQGPAVLTFIDGLTAQFDLRPADVILAGYSNGGTMAMRLACEAGTPFGALVTFGSPVSRTLMNAACPNATPALFVHGTQDGSNPFEGGFPRLFGVEVSFDGLEPPLSSPQTVAFWRSINGCSERAQTVDGTPTVIRYADCRSGARVAHMVLEGAGHFVPGDRPPPWVLRLIMGGAIPQDVDGYGRALKFWASTGPGL